MARKSRKNITVEEPTIKNVNYISVAQYIRLSVEDSNGKGNSIENQKLILDDFIAHNVNMKLYETYIDNGATGTNFKRPEFQRMIEDKNNNKYFVTAHLYRMFGAGQIADCSQKADSGY